MIDSNVGGKMLLKALGELADVNIHLAWHGFFWIIITVAVDEE